MSWVERPPSSPSGMRLRPSDELPVTSARRIVFVTPPGIFSVNWVAVSSAITPRKASPARVWTRKDMYWAATSLLGSRMAVSKAARPLFFTVTRSGPTSMP